MTTFASPALPVHPGALPAGGYTGVLPAAALTGATRLAEKTLELTFCAQFSQLLSPPPLMVWIGLTQAQERAYGFDAATGLGGQAIILQFKASCQLNSDGERRFKVPHDQLQTLRTGFGHLPDTCFYVFPDVGTVQELTSPAVQGDIVHSTWLVDVASVPNPVPLPYKTGSTTVLRQTGLHYADLNPPEATFRSDPFRGSTVKAADFARRLPKGKPNTRQVVDILRRFNSQSPRRSDLFFRNAVMGVYAG